MFFAQAQAEALLPALFERTDFVTRLRHLARSPSPVMLAAGAFRERFAGTILGLAVSFGSHESFFLELELGLEAATEQFLDHSFWRLVFIEGAINGRHHRHLHLQPMCQRMHRTRVGNAFRDRSV